MHFFEGKFPTPISMWKKISKYQIYNFRLNTIKTKIRQISAMNTPLESPCVRGSEAEVPTCPYTVRTDWLTDGRISREVLIHNIILYKTHGEPTVIERNENPDKKGNAESVDSSFRSIMTDCVPSIASFRTAAVSVVA